MTYKFNNVTDENSQRLNDLLDYSEEALEKFNQLTEDSIIHGTSPFRIGDPKFFYTIEGIQKQIDSFQNKFGIIYTLILHTDGTPAIRKTPMDINTDGKLV